MYMYSPATIETLGVSVITPLLNEFGGWPVLGTNPGSNWSESAFNLTRLLTSLVKYSNKPLISIDVSSDVKDSEKHIIYVSLHIPSLNYVTCGFTTIISAYRRCFCSMNLNSDFLFKSIYVNLTI